MQNEYLISIIIPVYNAKKYIKKGVESILLQEVNDLQIILVDDGSTDGSDMICDEFEKRENISVIHKENGGSSSARNSGIKVATGKYITFMDVDDYFEPNTFKEIYNLLNNNDIDLVDFGYNYVSSSGEKIPTINHNKKNCLFDKKYIEDVLIPPVINLVNDDEHFIFNFAWGKIYKNNIIKSHNVYFEEKRRIWEDRPFLVKYLRYCYTYYSMDKCFYNYVNVSDSLSHRYSDQSLDTVLKNYEICYTNYSKEYDFSIQYVTDYWANAVENMIIRQLSFKYDHPEVEKAIIEVLMNQQVIKWYKNRTIKAKYQNDILNLLKEEKYKKIIKVYESIIRKENFRNKKNEYIYKLKRFIKNIIS